MQFGRLAAHRRQPPADQPDPLVEEAEIKGIALQQGMPQGGQAPQPEGQDAADPPEGCRRPGLGVFDYKTAAGGGWARLRGERPAESGSAIPPAPALWLGLRRSVSSGVEPHPSGGGSEGDTGWHHQTEEVSMGSSHSIQGLRIAEKAA